MKNAPVRHRLEYVLYLGAKRLLLSLSHAGVRRLGARLGRFAFRIDRRRRRRALDNLERIFPEMPPVARERVARGCFEHFGATFFEIVSAARFDPEEVRRRFDISGWEHLERAVAGERGVFIMSGHFGSWELATYPLGLGLGGLDMVARPPDNPHIERDLERTRERFGNRLIAKQGAAHRMLNALRKRGRVALVIDQRVRPAEGIRVPFLGHPAWTTPVLAYLSLRTRSPVVPVFCYPQPDGRYRLEVRAAIEPPATGDAGADVASPEVAALTERYNRVVGDEVLRHPELWLWMHRRWDG